MAIYRIRATPVGRGQVRAWRRRVWRTLFLLWLTLLAAVAGLMILDPGPQPLSHKAFVALWNAANLVSTIGDFIALTHQQRAFLLVVGLTVLIVGGYAITTLTGILSGPAVLSYRENRSMERSLDRLADHVVVVGFAAIGRRVAEQLAQSGERVLIIDRGPSAAESAQHSNISWCRETLASAAACSNGPRSSAPERS